MLVTQVLIVFATIKDNPNLTLEELANKISAEHGDLPATKYLLNGQDRWMLKSRIEELDCVEEKDGRYAFNLQALRYSRDNMIDLYLKQFMKSIAITKKEVDGD